MRIGPSRRFAGVVTDNPSRDRRRFWIEAGQGASAEDEIDGATGGWKRREWAEGRWFQVTARRTVRRSGPATAMQWLAVARLTEWTSDADSAPCSRRDEPWTKPRRTSDAKGNVRPWSGSSRRPGDPEPALSTTWDPTRSAESRGTDHRHRPLVSRTRLTSGLGSRMASTRALRLPPLPSHSSGGRLYCTNVYE